MRGIYARVRPPILMAVALTALVALLSLTSASSASVSPPTATFTLRPGDATLGTATEQKMVGVPATPPKADIELAIDTTGSMQPSIDDAKADATSIVNEIKAVVPDTQFAVVQFKDNVDATEYAVEQSMTANATDIQTAINGLSAAGGGNDPEAYNLVFHNAADAATGWRAGTRKFVIVIGDAQPHGAGTAGVSGCTDATADPHGLNTATELAGMSAAQRTLFMIRQVSSRTTVSLSCYRSLAARAFPTGDAVDHGSSLTDEVVDLIKAAFANVSDVHLEVASASPAPAAASWISFSPASRGPVPAPSDQTFDLTATVPAGTPAGTYHFDIVAKADGVDIGHQDLTIVVPQKQLTLSPASASNPIGTDHTVTAHAFDDLGPFVGDTVTFSVTGPDASQFKSVTTGAGGTATFTVTNTSPTPGTDTIAAVDGTLTATATKTWVNAPPNCSAVKVDRTTLWPPNHKLVTVTASGATDSDIGDSAKLVIDAVTQDEPINGLGDGDTSPDATLASPQSDKAQVRAERSGLGDGRVIRLHVTATDTHGATCQTTLTVGVPHDQGAGATPIDSAPPSFNSLGP